MAKIKAEADKKVLRFKKVAEVQMRNVKMQAKDKARQMLEETVNRVKKQFLREMLHMLIEFEQMRE